MRRYFFFYHADLGQNLFFFSLFKPIILQFSQFCNPNNIHEKITQFWLAERGVQLFCKTSANLKHECKLQMLFDWLKTQKKPTRTNQIRAVLTTKIQENGHGFQQTTTGFNFVSKTTIEKLKKYSKNPNTVKSTSFWLNVLKMRC